MKKLLRKVLPKSFWLKLSNARRSVIQKTRGTLNLLGLNVDLVSNYYSPLPVIGSLEKHKGRWAKPSSLAGVPYDLDAMKALVASLVEKYGAEFKQLPSHEELATKGYGPGFTSIDGMTSYLMVRHLKPGRYFEVGSGLSTYYAWLAAEQNKKEGHATHLICIEPHPYEALHSIPGVTIIKKEVQDVEVSFFDQLEAGDIVFIDSSHVVKIDGDVPYLFLEILPRLKRGVTVHVHDIPFPYNTPFPSDFWIFKRGRPAFWTEAMLLQGLLSNSEKFKIMLSLPLLRFYEEPFLQQRIPNYQPNIQDANTFSSMWIETCK